MLLVLFSLPASLSRIPQTGFLPIHTAHILGSMLIFLIFFKRNKLSDRWLTFCLALLFYSLSIVAFLQYGLISAGFYLASAAIFIISVTMGLKAGFACNGLCGLTMYAFAHMWINGYLVFPGNVEQYIIEPSVWATLSIAFLATMAIFFVSASGFFMGFNRLVDEMEEQRIELNERTDELTRANLELEKLLDEVKTLSGLLPICSNCKKVRDDKGYWQQVEQYIQKNSQATITHGLCPDCIAELYPEIADKVLKKLRNEKS